MKRWLEWDLNIYISTFYVFIQNVSHLFFLVDSEHRLQKSKQRRLKSEMGKKAIMFSISRPSQMGEGLLRQLVVLYIIFTSIPPFKQGFSSSAASDALKTNGPNKLLFSQQIFIQADCSCNVSCSIDESVSSLIKANKQLFIFHHTWWKNISTPIIQKNLYRWNLSNYWMNNYLTAAHTIGSTVCQPPPSNR